MSQTTNNAKVIENGDLPDADNVMDNFSFVLDKVATILKDGATATNQDRYVKYADMTFTNVNTPASLSNSTYPFKSSYFGLYGGNIYDYYDGSVDGSKWTVTGSGSEVADQYIKASASGSGDPTTITSALKTKINIKSSGTTMGVLLKWEVSSSSSGGYSSSGTLYLSDGSNPDVSLSTLNPNSNAEIFLDFSSLSAVKVYKYGAFVTTVDVSSLSGGSWYLYFVCSGTVSGGNSLTSNVFVYPIVYTNESAITTQEVTSDALTLNSSADAVFFKGFDYLLRDIFPTMSLSTDNGGNFTTITNRTFMETISGSQLKVKVEFSGSPGRMKLLRDFGAFYG